ncbi:MAG TPA: 2'-5' RNA ligase family protein [Mesorhizobium sp.]|nr:2'-5' RNA ligase family protein [Mesorhizobium sp.]
MRRRSSEKSWPEDPLPLCASPSAPLILTLRLDERCSTFFEAERRRYFPPERNFIPAHVTLFHHLPGERQAEIEADLRTAARGQSPFPVQVSGLRFLGKGVAYRLEAPAFTDLRERLSRVWAAHLTPQDRQKIAPHVTIRNKVEPATAKKLFERLSASFRPFTAQAEGLLLWGYRGGPWSPRGRFPFEGSAGGVK